VPYSNIVSRTDAAALIPEQVSMEIMANLQSESAALSLFKRIPISTNQTRMPVLAALPTAYFVNGDTGLKQTTEANWSNKFLNVEELACIVPIPEAVLDDIGGSFDVWGSIRPLIEQAIGRALDAAVLFGVNKPASWPTDIVAGAAAVTPANTQARGASAAAIGGVAQDLNLLFGKIEADGFTPNGVIGRTSFKQIIRGARDTTGQALADLSAGTLWGEPLRFVAPGIWPAAGTGAAEAIVGDFDQAILGVRQDITFKVLDQAVIQDNTGVIQFNLAQQDMVALRVVARFAYQIANTLNYENSGAESVRYPFGVLTQP
jgi:HK97 family phage major capsid protein